MAAGFTIAIPTHNRRETLLLAVRSALAQTRAPQQVIVLCDGCTDGSAEAVHALGDERVQALELPKLPHLAYAHRNRALELARGEAIMWLGDDDLLLPDHLEQVGRCWDASRLDVVQTPAVVVWKDDTMTWVGLDWSIPGHRRTLEDRNTNVMSSVAVRVERAREVGGWDGALPRLGDWDLWKRVVDHRAATAMTIEPTVLHFRATGRQQPWPDRVAQNSSWFARISDPAALAAIRPELRALRAVREAEWMQDIDTSHADLQERQRHLAALDDRLQHAAIELERLREVERTLARVYSGGWWRLRRRLLPAFELIAKARAARGVK